MSLPYGFWPVVHTFGIDNYRVVAKNPLREAWNKVWWNDDPRDPNWPVFIEAVSMPKSQAPRNWLVMGGLLDRFPRRVFYGGPITRAWAPQYVKTFEDWAKSRGEAYETAIIPVQHSGAYRHPRTDFVWYVADETQPPKRYRYMRNYGGGSFRWVDLGYDQDRYANFRRQNPHIV